MIPFVIVILTAMAVVMSVTMVMITTNGSIYHAKWRGNYGTCRLGCYADNCAGKGKGGLDNGGRGVHSNDTTG